MKSYFSKIILLLVTVLCIYPLLNAQYREFVKLTDGKVTATEAFATPGAVQGCTNAIKVITFTAYITTSGPCKVAYKWQRSDNAIDNNVNSLSFTAAGTQKITTTWTMSVAQYEGWEAVQITQPNTLTSNRALFSIYCCNTGTPNTCVENPYIITPGADDIMKAFQHLVAKSGTKNCNPKVVTYNSTMNPKYYADGTGANGATTMDYAAFYNDVKEPSFHLLFAAPPTPGLADGYAYYGVCPPTHPILFPSTGENHVYEAYLVPVKKYKAATTEVKNSWIQLKALGIAPTDIASIVNWYYELKSGYIGTTEAANYNYLWSSNGLVVKVKMKSGEEVLSYLHANYNGGHTINWKSAVKCP